jgi:aminoglycoside phosphotransferase (APT) family kinase protein
VVVDEHLARRLVDSQFPLWAGLPLVPVDDGGVDNRTFRLGDELTVRMPSADGYALQVEKEQRWLPVLAPHLPLPVPTPVARGVAGDGYPHPWSVLRWIPGRTAALDSIDDLTTFATDLAAFLVALRRVDPTDGPGPGRHNFHRGGPLTTYAGDTLRAIDALGTEIPRDTALRVWDDAVTAAWRGDPVWFHGDVAAGNLLVRGGRLAAVIDFGTSGVGDPACDVVIAWTLLFGASRRAFRAALDVDAGTWTRGRGWALWKAVITLVGQLGRDPAGEAENRRVLAAILAGYTR